MTLWRHYAGEVARPSLLKGIGGPALFAGILGYVFDYLPHHPHQAQGRFDTSGFAPPR